ncbi:hypothetical protein [Adhaeretor mobilis]|uniref:Uncharacterized protein n=1 Tax=Adhaeretor mobilis TaxID=1930276 RepID=A0A517MSP6_9BACT|nr:hypothetical protein [Adhaeretor mobilis]QDS97908.1 hypothetical protein HG15A2_11760 [Adhaeretor mobilis]
MARETHKREDLLRDAVALVPRVKLGLSNSPEVPIFAGFRGEALSLYFDEDPAFHFNREKQLRRAYSGGQLYDVAAGKLRKVERRNVAGAMKLSRTELSAGEQVRFLEELSERLASLREAIASNQFKLLGEVPKGSDGLSKLTGWFAEFEEPTLANSARVS